MTRLSNAARKLVLLISLAGAPAYSADFFSHGVITIPELRVEGSWVRLFDTQEEWERFFSTAYPAAGSPAPTPPDIDFTQWRVVAGGTGIRMTGGTQLVIDRLYDMNTSVLVAGYVVNSGPGCLVTQNVNYPTIAIVIPQSEKPVQVGMLPAVFNCDVQSHYIPVD